jgi:hypothetical protein
MVECKSADNVLVRGNKGYRSDNPIYDATVNQVTIRTVNGDTATFSGNVAQFIGGTGSGQVAQTNVTDDGTNTIDNVERSDAQFAAMEAAWRDARVAAGVV